MPEYLGNLRFQSSCHTHHLRLNYSHNLHHFYTTPSPFSSSIACDMNANYHINCDLSLNWPHPRHHLLLHPFQLHGLHGPIPLLPPTTITTTTTVAHQPAHQSQFSVPIILYRHDLYLHRSLHLTFEPPHDKTNKMISAPSEDSDQPRHPPSLIRVFSVRMRFAWVLSYPLTAQRRLWWDWAADQANLSPCGTFLDIQV